MDDEDITCPNCGFAYPAWVEAYEHMIRYTGFCPYCAPRCPQTGTYPLLKMMKDAQRAN